MRSWTEHLRGAWEFAEGQARGIWPAPADGTRRNGSHPPGDRHSREIFLERYLRFSAGANFDGCDQRTLRPRRRRMPELSLAVWSQPLPVSSPIPPVSSHALPVSSQRLPFPPKRLFTGIKRPLTGCVTTFSEVGSEGGRKTLPAFGGCRRRAMRQCTGTFPSHALLRCVPTAVIPFPSRHFFLALGSTGRLGHHNDESAPCPLSDSKSSARQRRSSSRSGWNSPSSIP